MKFISLMISIIFFFINDFYLLWGKHFFLLVLRIKTKFKFK